jgi:Mg-chelatase subunit ChlI
MTLSRMSGVVDAELVNSEFDKMQVTHQSLNKNMQKYKTLLKDFNANQDEVLKQINAQQKILRTLKLVSIFSFYFLLSHL